MRSSLRYAIATLLALAFASLAVIAACGSDNFTAPDPDADVINPADVTVGDADASSPNDATSTPDAAPTWCQLNAPAALFCQDFDEADVLKAYERGTLKTTSVIATHDSGTPGMITIGLGDAGLSAPSELTIYEPELTTPGYETASLSALLPDAPGVAGFQLDFEVRVDVQGDIASSVAELYLTDLTYTSTTNTFDLSISGSGSIAENKIQTHTLGPRPAVGAWTHYRFVIPLTGNATASMAYGAPVDLGASMVLPTTTVVQLDLENDVSYVTAAVGNTQLSFDNVTLTALMPDAGDGG